MNIFPSNRYEALVHKSHPEIPKEVIQKFGFLRLTCRRKGINEYLQVQKKERKRLRQEKKEKKRAALETAAAKKNHSQAEKRILDATDRQSRAVKRAKIYN